jgi:amidohydrolase
MKNSLNVVVVFLLMPSLWLSAQTINTSEVQRLAYIDSARLVGIFKDLHANPEIAFMEKRTSQIVAKELQSLGYEVITGIAKTGVAAIIRNGVGPIVMYRADMDCNAVLEVTNLPYASNKIMEKEDGTKVPLMHACGHDAHITWMLGIAKVMVSLRERWSGTLVLIAQPAEETLQGAQAMVDDKMYEKGVPVPNYLFGMHTKPEPVGVVYNAPGERLSGSDQLDVIFSGIGGHGAYPQIAKDPIVMACNAVVLYQNIISRNIAAQDAAILTVGAFNAGSDNNVIPTTVILKLNIRWFNKASRNILLDGIKRVNEAIAIANGLPSELYPTIKMKGMVYPMVNDSNLVYRVNLALGSVIHKERLFNNFAPTMGSEDFHHLVLSKPGIAYDFLHVGVANGSKNDENTPPFSYHQGNYKVELTAIPFGVVVGSVSILEILKSK